MKHIKWVTLEGVGNTPEAKEAAELSEDFGKLAADINNTFALISLKKLGVDAKYINPINLGDRDIMDYSNESLITREKRWLALVNILKTGEFHWKFPVSKWTVIPQGSSDYLIGNIAKLARYVPSERRTPVTGELRDVYIMGSKEYVKDDLGTLTRRWAWCIRSAMDINNTQPMLKKLEGYQIGKYNQTPDVQKEVIEAITTKNRNTWHTLGENAKLFLAYLNYSNNGFMGVCLSSTTKKIRNNHDVPFKETAGHLLWKVDLARIPTDVVLVNIYAKSVATSTINGTSVLKTEKNHQWVVDGTVKNREIFCSYVPTTACTVTSMTQTDVDDVWGFKTPRVS